MVDTSHFVANPYCSNFPQVLTSMRSHKTILFFVIFSLCSGAVEADTRPNIVLIYADDMGYDAVSAYNDELGMDTPNIDRLVRQGMMFTDAHSSSGVCTPSRYSILTGRYHWRTRLKSGIVRTWDPPLIKDRRLTMPELLRTAGYDTAMFGKWHLGWHWPAKGGGTTSNPNKIDFDGRVTGGPVDHGFDYYFGDDVPNWPPYAWRENDRVLGNITTKMKGGVMEGVAPGPSVEDWSFEAVLPKLANRSAEYIRNRSDRENPFFLYFSMTSPHTPIAPSERFRGKTGITRYTDWLYETDWAVGRVLDALEKSGQAEETLVIFTADNGTAPNAKFDQLESKGVHLREHWRGWKADAYEGGHRVPFVVRWPGHVKPGSRSDLLVSQVDVMATISEILGRTLPPDAGEDSLSLLPLMNNPSREEPIHEAVIGHSYYGFYAVRTEKWKLLFCRGSGGWSPPNPHKLRPFQLYNLKKDPEESINLAEDRQERVENMKAILKRYVQRGRSTPGPEQPNYNGKTSWPHLPWH